MRSTAGTLAALGAALSILAGCGGDDGGPKLAKADLAAKADAICKDGSDRIDELGQPKDLKAFATLAQKSKPILDDEIDKLGSLTPEDAVAKPYGNFVQAVKDQRKLLDTLSAAAKENDRDGVVKAVSGAAKAAQARRPDIRALGFEECGQAASG